MERVSVMGVEGDFMQCSYLTLIYLYAFLLTNKVRVRRKVTGLRGTHFGGESPRFTRIKGFALLIQTKMNPLG